jgi:hypothetical protein
MEDKNNILPPIVSKTPLLLDDGTSLVVAPPNPGTDLSITGNVEEHHHGNCNTATTTSVEGNVLPTSHDEYYETQSILDTTRHPFLETITSEESLSDGNLVGNISPHNKNDDVNVVQDANEVLGPSAQLEETNDGAPSALLEAKNSIHHEINDSEEGKDNVYNTSFLDGFEHVDFPPTAPTVEEENIVDVSAPTDSEVASVALHLLETVNRQMRNITESNDNDSTTSSSMSNISTTQAERVEESSASLRYLCHAVRKALDLGSTALCPQCDHIVLHPKSMYVTCSNSFCNCRWCIVCGEAHSQFPTCCKFGPRLPQSSTIFDAEHFQRERTLYMMNTIKHSVPLHLWRQLTEKFRLVTTTENISWEAVDRAAISWSCGSFMGTKMAGLLWDILHELHFELRQTERPRTLLPLLSMHRDDVQYYAAPQQRQRSPELGVVIITVVATIFAFALVTLRSKK